MWTLELLAEEGNGGADDGGTAVMPPPASTTQLSGSESQQTAKAKGPWFLTAGEFLLGRKVKTCQIHLTQHTVSREHARLTVRPLAAEEVTAVGSLQAVEITDLNSRLGTFLSDETERLEPHTPRALKAGDVLKFPGARLRLRHQPMVLCYSNMTKASRAALKAAAAKVGAHMATQWSPLCTHLLVDKAPSPTLKVAMAVVQGKPVVDLPWLTEGVLSRREGKPAMPLPDPARFAPSWSNVGCMKDAGRPRTGAFKGMRFVFVQPDEAEELVRLAGASVEQAHMWDPAQLADPGGTLAARRGAGVRATVLCDSEQEATQALAKTLQRTPGVDAVSTKGCIAKAIFAFSPLRDKDDAVIALSPEAAPAPKAAAAAAGGAPPSAGKGGSKGSGKPGKAAAAAAAAAAKAEEEAEAEGEKEQAAAAVASPARTTRRSARAGADDAAEGGEAALTTPGGGGSSSTRATRSRATPAAEAGPATAGSTARKRGRKAVEAHEEEGAEAEAVASPGRRSKRVAKGKGPEPEAPPEEQKAAAAAMEEEASGPGKRKGREGEQPAAAAEPEQQQQQAQQEKGTPSKRSRRGGGGRGTSSSQEEVEEQQKKQEEEEKQAEIPADKVPPVPAAPQQQQQQPFSIRRPPPPRRVKPLNPAEGWLEAPRKAPPRGEDGEDEMEEGEDRAASQSQQSGRARRRRRAGDEEEDGEDEEGAGRPWAGKAGGDEDDEDGPIDGTTVVEERDLLGGELAFGGSLFTYYWQAPPGQGGAAAAAASPGRGTQGSSGAGDGRLNFKRFRKNSVRGVTGEAPSAESGPIQARRAVVRREDLISVLPKESEMELRLKHEEALEMARAAEGEKLFEEEEEGPRRRKR